ncbi:MAG TPA: histidine kinase [Gemmatimonadales bacterium]|nr:histidine kinase [Gemmatimonadales bacterium]
MGRLRDTHYAPRVRVERLIATGRVVLAAFSLLAVWIGPATHATNAEFTNLLLAGYLGYALLLAFVAWFGHAASFRIGLLTHAIDLALFSVFVYLTEGAASPFFTYFIFAIVAATLRWQARGALWTAAMAVVAFSTVGLYAAFRDPTFELQRFFTQSAYLIVLASLLAALSAYENRRRDEMASLAAWPPAVGPEPRAVLRELLGSTARILNAQRTLLAWEETGQPWLQFGAWSDDSFTVWREPADRYDPLVADPLENVSFLSPDVSQQQATVVLGEDGRLQAWRGTPIHEELRSRFHMRALLSVRVGGEWVRGRLFSLDNRSLTADDLVLGEIVAGHLAASLDHIVQSRRLRQAAAAEARARLSRDLHDGVLQSLTGAALKLEAVQRLWETQQPAARERLSEIQHLLAQEQRGLRFLIRDTKLTSADSSIGGTSLSERLNELVRRFESVWGLKTELLTDDLDTGIADSLAYEICNLVQEALVNAARHATASHAHVALRRHEDQLFITVTDDGHGFPFQGHYDHAMLTSQRLGPVMLKQRVESLGGTLEIESTNQGAHLEIALPYTGAGS